MPNPSACALLALSLLGGGAMAGAHATPFVPSGDDEIVERLPARLDRAERAQRAALAQAPDRLPQALAVARQSIERARREGDPRELGVAQSALAPWWADPAAPAPVRLLRATILQSRHEFEAAMTELDRLVDDAVTPPAVRAQALLTRASLHQMHGRFDASRQDCEALRRPPYEGLGPVVRLDATACLLELRSLHDDPRAASDALEALALGAAADPWLALLRAELAERLGDDDRAPALWQAATADADVYALAAHADWLLDRGRALEALAALERGPAQADALQLRRVIAWQRLGDARASAAAAALRETYAAIRLRGDPPHLREESRLALDVDHDATRALALALEQWSIQKEPADAVLLWRAARAAGRPHDAAVVRDWLPAPAGADVRLAGLPARDGGRP